MENKPNFKKCENCGDWGMVNDKCPYFRKDLFTEVRCAYFEKHPKSKKKEVKK